MYDVDTQKNGLNETNRLSTQNIQNKNKKRFM